MCVVCEGFEVCESCWPLCKHDPLHPILLSSKFHNLQDWIVVPNQMIQKAIEVFVVLLLVNYYCLNVCFSKKMQMFIIAVKISDQTLPPGTDVIQGMTYCKVLFILLYFSKTII